MRSFRSALARGSAALLCAAVLGSGLAVAAAPAARASTADADQGSPITRQTVVERALSWTDEAVPYSQSSYWPASAPRTGAGHSYRQDCSGFVSMAWDLASSAVTGDFVSSSSPYDTQITWDQLQPGDLLGVDGHVVLFLGWSDIDKGQHRWFDMVSEATPGTNASVQRSQDRQGYWSSYTPYRYRAVLDDAPVTVAAPTGRVDQFVLDAAGHVQHRSATPGGSWSGLDDVTAGGGFATFRTGLTATSTAPGQLDVLGAGRDGDLVDLHWDGARWTQVEYASPAGTLGFAAAGVPGSSAGPAVVQLVARAHSASDVDGALLQATVSGGAFSGWSAVPGAPVVTDDPAITRTADGRTLVAVETTSGAIALGTLTTAWSWSSPFGTTRVAARPAIGALADGTVVLVVVGGGVLQTDTIAPGAPAAGGFSAVAGVPTLVSAPAVSSAATPPGTATAAPLDVYAEAVGGAVVTAERSTAGAWTYLGAGTPGPIGATAAPVARTLNRS